MKHVPTPALTRVDKDGIATLTLSWPDGRNTLSEEMLAALNNELTALATDASIHAVIIASTGTTFSAGHDLREMTARRSDPDRGRAYFTDILGRCATVMQKIVHLPQPVIAAVEGVATAAGCQLVATCDLAVAGAGARFCTPGVHIGLFCSTPMVALSRNLSNKHAMEMLLLGEMIDAETAHRFGLVNRTVPQGEALAEATKLAAVIASKSRYTVRVGKKAFYAQREKTLEEAYCYASEVMVENMLARDAEEGIDAFRSRREPGWSQE